MFAFVTLPKCESATPIWGTFEKLAPCLRRHNLGEICMKIAIALVLIGLAGASCTKTEKGAGIGAATGAIIGGAITGDVRGAAVGAAIGGVSGAVIGHVADQPGQCYYRDRYGRRYIDDC